MSRLYGYRVVVTSVGTERITENRILDSSGKYNYGCGNMGPSGYAANAGPMESAPNDVFTVTWRDAQNVAHEQVFDMREKVRSSFQGEFVFILGADGKFTVEVYESHRGYPMPRRPGA